MQTMEQALADLMLRARRSPRGRVLADEPARPAPPAARARRLPGLRARQPVATDPDPRLDWQVPHDRSEEGDQALRPRAKPRAGRRRKAGRSGKKRPRFGGKAEADAELVGLKIGATQHRGRARRQQRRRTEAAPGRAADAARRASSRRRGARRARRSRPGSTSSSARTSFRAAASASGSRPTTVGVRMFEIAGIDDETPARERGALPRARGRLDPRRRGGHRLPRDRPRGRRAAASTNRKILLVVAYRDPIERFIAAFREAGIELVGVDLEAFALLRARQRAGARADQPPAAAVVVAERRPRAHDPRGLRRQRLPVHARARVGRPKLASAIERDLHVSLEAGAGAAAAAVVRRRASTARRR